VNESIGFSTFAHTARSLHSNAPVTSIGYPQELPQARALLHFILTRTSCRGQGIIAAMISGSDR
jgi:hypothetical protein